MKIILKHLGGSGETAIDFLATSDSLDQAKKEIEYMFYQIKCEAVEKYLKKHPEFIYLGSQDLEHDESRNRCIEVFLLTLINQGWKEVKIKK